MATIWVSMQERNVVMMVQMEYLLFVVAIDREVNRQFNQSEI